jgi:hypothetical protein
MDTGLLTGIDWVAAAIAPHAIGPHPNFSQDDLRPVQLLALLADGRYGDFARHEPSLAETSDIDESEMQLVLHVRDSLLAGSQGLGVDGLVEVATGGSRRPALSPGARASAALFASVAMSELDQIHEAVELLRSVLDSFGRQEDYPSDSMRLVDAVVRQQLVVRLVEADSHEEAMKEAAVVERTVPGRQAAFEGVDVSAGSSFTSRQLQHEISRMMRLHSTASMAVLEPFGGRRWVRVVRAKPSLIDERFYRTEAKAGTALVDETFERRVSWSRGTKHFGGGDPVDGPVSTALLHAELSGDLGQVRRRRELLGKLRTLRPSTQPSWSVSEALRLLRQSDTRQPLEDLLRVIRAEGPLDVLVSSVQSVLNRLSAGSATRCELVVLSSGTEIMSEPELGKAILGAMAFRESPRQRVGRETLVPWAAREVAWRHVARLLPHSGFDDVVAQEAFAELSHGQDLAQPLEGSLENLVRLIDWQTVSDSVRSGWVEWARAQTDARMFGLATGLLDAVYGVQRHDFGPPRPERLDLAARILWEVAHDVAPDADEVASAANACISTLASIRQTAATGAYGFGGISAADVAVLLATELDQSQLWEPLFDFLLDPRVGQHDKAPALDRMVVLGAAIPDEVIAGMADSPFESLHGHAADPFESTQLPFSPGALRFCAAYGLIEQGFIISAIAELTSSSHHAGRVEAARSVPPALQKTGGDPLWAAVTLLQLSHDGDPVVRSEAGRSLAATWNRYSSLTEVVVERLLELLAADGILVPLLTLRGLSETRDLPDRMRAQVHALGHDHRARPVREAALGVLGANS